MWLLRLSQEEALQCAEFLDCVCAWALACRGCHRALAPAFWCVHGYPPPPMSTTTTTSTGLLRGLRLVGSHPAVRGPARQWLAELAQSVDGAPRLAAVDVHLAGVLLSDHDVRDAILPFLGGWWLASGAAKAHLGLHLRRNLLAGGAVELQTAALGWPVRRLTVDLSQNRIRSSLSPASAPTNRTLRVLELDCTGWGPTGPTPALARQSARRPGPGLPRGRPGDGHGHNASAWGGRGLSPAQRTNCGCCGWACVPGAGT